MSAIPYCEQYGTRLVTEYEALSFEDVHADLIAILPAPGGTVLDIGSGSGRDCGVARGKRIRRRGRRAVRGHARPRARETRVEPICSNETLIGIPFQPNFYGGQHAGQPHIDSTTACRTDRPLKKRLG